MDQWTNTAVVSGITPKLPEGFYWFSVKAYNNIQRGGPLTTTVCSTVPLAIDITKPVFNSMQLDYDDDTRSITINYNFT